MPSRLIALTAATFAVVLTFVGCGDAEPRFDASTQYSPASLASEFRYRYQSLDPSKTAADRTDGAPTKSGAVSKTGGATKAASPITLAALLDDMAEKAAQIPNLTPAEARKAFAAEVAKDSTIRDADKQTVAERMARAD
jgi:hypothetical protein